MIRILLPFFILLCLTGNAQTSPSEKEINISDTFPVPKNNKDMLFYVQRTHNKNTIVYELNYNADSSLNSTSPVKMYWIRYSDKGEIAQLSYVQKKYAYGIESLITDTTKKSFKINFVSYKKRDLFLMKLKEDNKYRAYMLLDGKLCYLTKVFVKIDGGTFWVPHITYVELTGIDPSTGKKVREKIKP